MALESIAHSVKHAVRDSDTSNTYFSLGSKRPSPTIIAISIEAGYKSVLPSYGFMEIETRSRAEVPLARE
jgi:hypothetical protein